MPVPIGGECLPQHGRDDAETFVARRACVRLHRVSKVVAVGAHDDRPGAGGGLYLAQRGRWARVKLVQDVSDPLSLLGGLVD